MNPYEKTPGSITPLTEAEKAAVRERLLKSPGREGAPKLIVRKEIPKNDPELAKKILEQKRKELFPERGNNAA